MADELEGARVTPVKFIDQGDGTVAERLTLAERQEILDRLEAIKTAVEAMKLDADTINLNADQIELNTDQVEATLEEIRVLLGAVSFGYQQLASTNVAATLASLCAGAVIPVGATRVLLTPSAQIRWRDDGVNPTAAVGYPIPGGIEFDYDLDQIAQLKVYGLATIDAQFYA